MVREYTVIIEKDEEGLLVSEVLELPGCHTQAKTMNELLERTREAIRAFLKTSARPKIKETFVSIQKIEA